MRHKTHTVVRLTGFSPDLLRSWERRHGLLAPERTEGGHRLYTDEDLAVLGQVRQLREEGRSIGAIAEEGRERLLARHRQRTGGPTPLPLARERRALTEAQLLAARSDLVRCAIQVDSARFVRAMATLKRRAAPQQYVPEVLAPVCARIGELWEEGVCSVAGEHMASAVIRGCLIELLGREVGAETAGSGARVVCAGVPGERHENPGLFWALGQAWQGARVVWLGVDLPFDELHDACEQLRPDEIHLSVTLPDTLRACLAGLRAFEAQWAGRAVVRLGGAGLDPEGPRAA